MSPGSLGYQEYVREFLHTSVWITGFKEFIILWVLAKVGAGWVYHYRAGSIAVQLRRPTQQPTKTENQKEEEQRAVRYNMFMIGNALSIIFGVLGALIILQWLE